MLFTAHNLLDLCLNEFIDAYVLQKCTIILDKKKYLTVEEYKTILFFNYLQKFLKHS